MNEKLKDQCENTACKPTNELIREAFAKLDSKVSIRVFLATCGAFSVMAGWMFVNTMSISTSAAVIAESVKNQGKIVAEHILLDSKKHDKLEDNVRDLEKSIYGKAP